MLQPIKTPARITALGVGLCRDFSLSPILMAVQLEKLKKASIAPRSGELVLNIFF